ncbi:hypothetical protein [Hymenobacter defluvii]|uniref:Glycosyltransferase RgtA/B/C/D-like domain-containing protein n=1 Tax=Hymenobacter defluvii TaxID=2054411 RepID=A0ABS3T7E9_9BACT|nr:hypothetical protein [Hymenobacter defluvii]MBO3269554.1 hypothetical protein [Hymenobacter defluvii]
MWKRSLFSVLIVFVLAWLGRSFYQYMQLPIDGDLAAIVVPLGWYARVLHDPFGWAVLTHDAVYAAPNRFFAHVLLNQYFRHVPGWLQHFLAPIQSVYVAIALLKLLTHLLLLYLLAVYATGASKLNHRGLWLVMALLLPLFQTAGYNLQMGIIDHATTYAAFYALPMALLLLLLLPFYRAAQHGVWRPLRWVELIALIGLTMVVAFNGSVVLGAVAVLLPGIVLYALRRQAQVDKMFLWSSWQPILLLSLLGLLCVYSLYIGLNNSENPTVLPSLWERYQRLPLGFFRQFTVKLGLPLLLVMLLLNAQLIRRVLPATSEGQHLLRSLRWLALFALVYILLLPLGGYRPYRPLLLRRDTVLPIILGMVCLYGASSYYVWRYLPMGRLRVGYIVLLGVFSAIFLNADRLHISPVDNNNCEQQALSYLAHAPAGVVQLPQACPVLSWNVATDPAQITVQAHLLNLWGITRGLTGYYQQPPDPTQQLLPTPPN